MDSARLDIDFALATAAVRCGEDPAVIVRRLPAARAVIPGIQRGGKKAAVWKPEEDAFIRANWATMSTAQIAQALGRSKDAVKIRSTRRHTLPNRRRDSDSYSALHISRLLGVDQHQVSHWINQGMLPSQQATCFDYSHLVVRHEDLLRWVTRPANWIWFDPDAIPDPHISRLVQLKKARWGDEWWNTRQVADYHGVKLNDVSRYIKLGHIRATPAPNRSGRKGNGWRHSFILRSEATRPELHFAKAGNRTARMGEHFYWSHRADRFLILAIAIGLSDTDIAILTGWQSKRVGYRRRLLIVDGIAAAIIQEDGLPVEQRDGKLFADWVIHAHRFPHLRRAVKCFAAYLSGDHSYPIQSTSAARPPELRTVRSILSTWAQWFANTPEEKLLANAITYGSIQAPRLKEWYAALLAWGIDPLGLPIGLLE